MKIAAICPTYKRPEKLANAVACFLRQIPHAGAEYRLFVLDDAGQHAAKAGPVTVVSTGTRRDNLPAKYRDLVALANEWGADAYAVWEDDDIFLPNHLNNAARAFEGGYRWYRTPSIWSTYGCPWGECALEGAEGRFHSSWAFTRELYEAVGGYPATGELNFDQQLRSRLMEAPPAGPVPVAATYVYRWGNAEYHGSAAGDGGYSQLWNDLGLRPAPFVGPLIPHMDAQTTSIYRFIGIA